MMTIVVRAGDLPVPLSAERPNPARTTSRPARPRRAGNPRSPGPRPVWPPDTKQDTPWESPRPNAIGTSDGSAVTASIVPELEIDKLSRAASGRAWRGFSSAGRRPALHRRHGGCAGGAATRSPERRRADRNSRSAADA